MDVHVRVDLDADGPVVVKWASGPAVERLRGEGQRLVQAVHPGVVALARGGHDRGEHPHGEAPGAPGEAGHVGAEHGHGDRDDGYELRTCYAGEPVSRWSGSLTDVAGLGAAVASTLADLHELGIVHGRVDASHILIGDDGRPRLCGLAPPGDVVSSDDVAALGQVLDELVTRAHAERRGLLRWPCTSSSARRSLRQVVERATDPVPTRRPSARVLADTILAAVPTAALPSGPARTAVSPRDGNPGAGAPPVAAGARTRHRSRATAVPHNMGPAGEADTLDRIWSYADEQSDDERWAAAFGDSPPDLPLAADDTLPIVPVDTPDWSVTAFVPDERDPWSSALSDLRPADTGTRGAADDDGLGLSDRRRRARPDDDPTRDYRPPAGHVGTPEGTSRADGGAAAAARGRRTIGLAAAAAALVAVAAAGAVVVGSGGDADTSRSGPPASAAAAGACPPAAAPVADVDGDGCRDALVVDGGMVYAGGAQWTLGEPGDLVTLGDWDCDGDASAALLRPATGDVFVFSAWAATGEPVTVRSSQRVDGAVGIRAEGGDGGCDRLLLDLAEGGAAPIEVLR